MSVVKSVNKILIFRLSSIGDIILTSALIRCIKNKYPRARVDFVIKKQFYQLVESNPHINNIYIVDKGKGIDGLKQLAKSLKEENYDVFLDIHKNFRSLYVRNFSGANKIFTFNKQVLKRTLLTSFGINIYKYIKPVYLRYIEAAKQIGVEYDGNGTEVFIPEYVRVTVSKKLQNNGIYPDYPFVALCPGASFKNKQWIPERFAELASLINDRNSLPIVVIGGDTEVEIGNLIVKNSSGKVVNLAGKLNLLESGAVLSRARVVVVNDTGMLMMAESQHTPVVGIYGPTAKWFGFYPILPQSEVVEVDLKCRPCTKMGLNECPKKHWKCMLNISTEMVYEKVSRILSI